MAISKDVGRRVGLYISAALLAIGIILLMYGGVKMFRLNVDQAQNQGLFGQQQLRLFVDCDQLGKKFAFSKGAQQGMYWQCAIRQAPYLIMIVFAGIFSTMALITALIAGTRGTQKGLYLAAIFAAVAIMLTLSSAAAVLFAAEPVSRLIPNCKGLSPMVQQAVVNNKDMQMTCLETDTERRPLGFEMHRLLKIFGAGVVISFISLLLLSGFMSSVFSHPRLKDKLPANIPVPTNYLADDDIDQRNKDKWLGQGPGTATYYQPSAPSPTVTSRPRMYDVRPSSGIELTR